MTYCNCN